QKLAADACVWEFGSVDFNERPEQFLGMRGICYVELEIECLSQDGHSGIYGSMLPNAAWRLVWALNTLKDQNEHILIPGHYDDVLPPTEFDLELFETLPDQTADHKQLMGANGFLLDYTGGPELQRFATMEPTCTICGLESGYTGPGSKTVLPAKAMAKIDFR